MCFHIIVTDNERSQYIKVLTKETDKCVCVGGGGWGWLINRMRGGEREVVQIS